MAKNRTPADAATEPPGHPIRARVHQVARHEAEQGQRIFHVLDGGVCPDGAPARNERSREAEQVEREQVFGHQGQRILAGYGTRPGNPCRRCLPATCLVKRHRVTHRRASIQRGAIFSATDSKCGASSQSSRPRSR